MDDAQRLAEIQEREKAATEGPWDAHYLSDDCADIGAGMKHLEDGIVQATWVCSVESGICCGTPLTTEECANVKFIAHARSDIPWLLAKVEDLQTILKEFAFLDGITPDGIVDVEQFCVRLRALAAKAAEETTDA